jgi:hypothetical protein
MRVAYPLETTGYDAVIAGILLNNAPALLEAIKADSKGSDVPASIFSVAFDYRTLGEGYYWQAYFTTVLDNGAHIQRAVEPEKPSTALGLLSGALSAVFPPETVCDPALEQDLFFDGLQPIYLIES